MRRHRQTAWTLAAALFVVGPALGAEDTGVTRRARSDVREGPGTYYPLVCVLPADTRVRVLSRDGAWWSIRPQDPSLLPEGTALPPDSVLWISRNCFADKPASGTPRELSFPWESLSASPSAVSAAVRGFALRYEPDKAGCIEEMEGLGHGLVTPEEAARFRAESRQAGGCRCEAPGRLPADPALHTPYQVTLAEEGIGQALAARIADRGLLEDRTLQRYVNLLAAYLAEHTGAYDAPFSVYVLRGHDLYAMAVPGGKVFLTDGMVRACGDEAELAGVVAHEMMHLVLGHGLREVGERPVQIKRDLAMGELDARAGQPADPVMEGLERTAADAYESVHKPRLQRYEAEADRAAMLLMARAGYDPKALPRMVSAIAERVASQGGAAADNPFLQMDFRKRAEEAASFAAGQLKGSRGCTHRERFLRNTSSAPSDGRPAATPAAVPGPAE